MLLRVMKPPGTFKIAGRNRALPAYLDADNHRKRRTERIIESLRSEILEGGGGSNVRIRRIFENPREVFRLEIELPLLGYQRITLLDRDALDSLLEAEDVRALLSPANPSV